MAYRDGTCTQPTTQDGKLENGGRTGWKTETGGVRGGRGDLLLCKGLNNVRMPWRLQPDGVNKRRDRTRGPHTTGGGEGDRGTRASGVAASLEGGKRTWSGVPGCGWRTGTGYDMQGWSSPPAGAMRPHARPHTHTGGARAPVFAKRKDTKVRWIATIKFLCDVYRCANRCLSCDLGRFDTIRYFEGDFEFCGGCFWSKR